ncbi:MAG: tetratricopeptide repeat-containing sensor histidine kinase [Flavitalea sp.]
MSKLMHHRIILFLSCLPVLFHSNAQTATKQDSIAVKIESKIPANLQADIDSLKVVLNNTPLGDDKFKLYGKICWAYAGSGRDLESARPYADSIRIGAEKLNDKAAVAYAHFYYGFIARFEGNYSQGLDHLEKFIQYNTEHGDSIRVASGLYQVGVITQDMGDYDKSLSSHHRVLSIWQKEGNYYQVGSTLNSIGVILKKMKRYHDAIEKYQSASAIFDSLGVEDRGYVRTNMANAYAEINEFEKASYHYAQAVSINKEYNNEVEVAACLQNIGKMLNKLQRYDSALVYHLQSFSILEHTPQKHEIAMCLHQIGYTHLKMENYSVAQKNLTSSLSIAIGIMAKPLMRDIYEDLSHLYAKQKDFAKAYEYHQLFSTLKDNVLNETTTQQLNELETRYETGEKDKQIVLLEKEWQVQEKEAQRQATLKKAFIGGLLLISLLAILLVYIFRQRFKNQKLLSLKNNEIRDADFKRHMSELEMKALRAQINPHFLFNCMNSINRMILQGETERASAYLTKFSKLVRLILENAETPTVSLENELALLESYIQLEELRFKGKISYNISVDKSIEPESTYLPSMVLQPFVENAIWHGLMHKEGNEKGKISIAVIEENGRLLCTIEDNGVGRERAQQLLEKSVLKGRSMGMKITEDRLKLLNNGSAEPIIWITDLKDTKEHPTGTRIEINIPIS